VVDTGSVESLISDKIINDLGLTHSKEYVTIIDSNNNEIKSHRFPCYLMFDGHNKTFDMNIGIINRKNVDIIIGMDILELVEINIKNGIFTIS
jgi:predicted aspartyl protease